MKLLAGFLIVLIHLLKQRIFKAGLVNDRVEGGVAAVVGPVGVQNAHFGDGRVAPFLPEIRLAAGQIVGVHRKTVPADEAFQLIAAEIQKSRQGLDTRREVIADGQGLRLFQRGLTGLDRVDDILFNLRDLRLGELAVQRVHTCRTHQRPVPPGEDLDALGGGIGPLVELAGQILHRENRRAPKLRRVIYAVKLRLGKDGFYRVIKQLFPDVFHIIALEQAHPLQPRDPQQLARVI